MPEQTLMNFYPSRIAFLKYYFLGVLFIILGIVLFSGIIEFLKFLEPYRMNFLYLIPLGIILIFAAEAMRLSDKFTITDFRIIERYGIISRNEEAVPLEKVANYSITQTGLERLFNIGDIIIQSSGGSEEPEITMNKAPKIREVKELLDKIIHK